MPLAVVLLLFLPTLAATAVFWWRARARHW